MFATRMAKWGSIIASILICVIGILLIVYPDISMVFFSCFMGILFMVYGVFKMIGYFSKDLYRLAFQFDLACGILFFTIGFSMLLHPEGLMSFLNIIIGIIVFADGLFKLQIALDARRFGLSKWWLIIIIALIACCFGLIEIIRPMEAILMICTGLTLLLDGILNLFIAVYTVKVQKRTARTPL